MKLLKVIRTLVNSDAAKGHRAQVLARFVWAHLKFLFEEEFVYKWVNNTKIYIVHHRAASTECYYYGLFDPEEMSILRDSIQDGDVFADVGANIGGYSIFAASYGAEVYAFEPVPSTFELLKRNIKVNPGFEDKIHPVMKVISDSEGMVTFTIDSDTTNKVISDDSIVINGSKVEKIPSVTLDEIVDKVNVLKIDTEGHEKSVLKGAGRILSSNDLRLIILEDPDDEIKSLLMSYGFTQCNYDIRNKKTIPVKNVRKTLNGIFIRS